MTIRDIINRILEDKCLLKKDVAGRLNIKQGALSDRLSRNNLSTDVLGETLNAVDYKLIAVPRNRKLADDEFQIINSASVNAEPNMTKVDLELLEKTKKEDAIYDLWLKKTDMSVEEYTNKLSEIFKDDSKEYKRELERYMTWYKEHRLN